MENFLEQLEAQRHIPAHGMFVGVVIFLVAYFLDLGVKMAFARALVRATESGKHPDVATRLVLTQRLTRVGLWLVTVALVASQFEHLRTLGTTLLASAGVAGLVVGMAARSTFANLVAGIQIAFTQPVRVGDIVTLRDETGEVEDITLSYTFIRTGDGRRLAIPNEVLSNEVIKNFSLRDPRVQSNASFFIGYAADLPQVRELLLAAAKGCPARDPKAEPSFAVAALTETAIKVQVYAWALTPAASFDLGGQLRETGLLALLKAKVPLPVTRFDNISPAN
jgi:small-conductance mechanosensitive channel